MMTQLKVIQNDLAEGNPLVGTHGATGELQHLLDFNQKQYVSDSQGIYQTLSLLQ